MEFWVEVKPENTLKVTPGEDNLIHISQGTLVSTEKIRESVILTVTVDKTNLVIGILSQDKFPQISFNLVFEKDFELSHNCSKGSVHFIGYKSPNIHQYSAVAVTDSGSVEPAATSVVNSDDPKPDVKLKMSKVIGEALGEGTVCIKSGSEEKKLKLSDTLIEAFRDVKCSSEEAKRHLSDALIEALRKSTGCIKNGSEEEQLSDTLTEALGNIKCGSEENELKLSDTLIEALRNIKCGSEEEKLKLSDTLIETLWKSNIRFDIEYEKKKISDFLAERGCKEFKPSPRQSKL